MTGSRTAARPDPANWTHNPRRVSPRAIFEEDASWPEGHWYEVTRAILETETAEQEVRILETVEYGKILVLDGHLQSAEEDEAIYHEALVQPAMLLHPAPRSVLIVGGGEGATAREALKHPSVSRVVMVDLDAELIAICRQHLPEWHRGALDDPRLELVIADGLDYVAACNERFDVIVLDLVDAFEDGPSEALFSEAFFAEVKRLLAPGGVLAVQAMELNPNGVEDHAVVRRNLRPAFAHVMSYSAMIPSFWSEWGFILAADAPDPAGLTPEEADRRIAARGLALSALDGATLLRMRTLSKPVRDLLAAAGAP
ncbi:methyltransferase domain-containing protein [Roseomonas alkaliterrae]|uniref:Polyamine aminopropyltransferase n=1 Tax=Neoroseomonas alkaliterrae TaxID=1452450 RepID=A0A840YC86_9PROT|nr:spermidine synthase [Neoroseomonas alkaliterrae]MBR0677076.1 methyltransferase domain-containing protein [Neoroseomonas alkaliterrae]